jgi:hypothetical protein
LSKETTQLGSFGRVLGALMESRNRSGSIPEMMVLAEETGLDVDVFMERVSGNMSADLGDLTPVAEALGLTNTERRILAKAYTFEEGDEDDVRAQLFSEITSHLDFVAALAKEMDGDWETAKRIREVLIPFVERTGGLKSDAENWAEHKARQNQ